MYMRTLLRPDEMSFDDLASALVKSFALGATNRQGRNQVYGIRDHSLGIGIMDPGSRVTSDGIRISQFFWSWRGSRIDRFLDTLLFMRNKNIPFCKEKGLFSGLLKKLLTFILLFFYVSVTQLAI